MISKKSIASCFLYFMLAVFLSYNKSCIIYKPAQIYINLDKAVWPDSPGHQLELSCNFMLPVKSILVYFLFSNIGLCSSCCNSYWKYHPSCCVFRIYCYHRYEEKCYYRLVVKAKTLCLHWHRDFFRYSFAQ